ncbi:hypothetical protein B0H16DRAFT_737235 [Mycena metata]|uniref:Uncharacterized protein n=1 Tax=Mycena metata TaxID=1033252 RepID=A0AAD7J464_9AGAR|nr:hypothetical protein B0H16DRAFT_737235 [Mycena metata]
MGEIDLQHEIQFDDDSGVVYRRRGQRRARRMYSARIDGCKTAMTVALYQGPNAEQAWQKDISMHSWLRHPNFVQLYGVASTGPMYAAVFHDDLIPLEQFRNIHCNSPILSLYFRAYWSHEFQAVNYHLISMFNRTLDEDSCTLWIRASTRRLCVDDMILNDELRWWLLYLRSVDHWEPGREDIDRMSYNGPNYEAMVISSLALSDYHKFRGIYSSHSRGFSFPAHATATVGMVVKHDSNCEVELPVNIVFLPLLDVRDMSWHCSWSQPDGAPQDPWIDAEPEGDLMPDSWRRYNLHQICAAALIKGSMHRYMSFGCAEVWLSQANHIFSSLQIRSNHNQYDCVEFTWAFSPTTRSSCPSQGWLFMRLDDQLRSGPSSFRWPDCATYWSRDPFGAVRLSPEEAEEAGFPLITLKFRVSGHYWDSVDYAELWKFHQAKGFASDSQEIARHLGHPLYQLCDEVAVETPFAHGKLSLSNLNVH